MDNREHTNNSLTKKLEATLINSRLKSPFLKKDNVIELLSLEGGLVWRS